MTHMFDSVRDKPRPSGRGGCHMRISSVMLFLFADAAKKYELSQVGSDAPPVAVKENK